MTRPTGSGCIEPRGCWRGVARLAATAALGTALVVTGCAAGGAPGLPTQPVAGRLRKLNGEVLNLAGLRGTVALVSVIQTWSDPALVEVPLFKEMADRYGDRLRVVCVALDEQPEMVRIFQQTFDIDYDVVVVEDPARFTGPAGPFGPITVVPTSVLLDRFGRVAARMDGTWPPQVLQDALAQLISE